MGEIYHELIERSQIWRAFCPQLRNETLELANPRRLCFRQVREGGSSNVLSGESFCLARTSLVLELTPRIHTEAVCVLS